MPSRTRERYVATAPPVPLKAAARAFGDPRHFPADDFEWARMRPSRPPWRGDVRRPNRRSVDGPAMPDGAWCLFSVAVEGAELLECGTAARSPSVRRPRSPATGASGAL